MGWGGKHGGSQKNRTRSRFNGNVACHVVSIIMKAIYQTRGRVFHPLSKHSGLKNEAQIPSL